MPRYWVMRTHHESKSALWKELQEGRLRQGWGHEPEQDLRIIASQVQAGEELDDAQHACWRGNRRMLATEPDGIRIGDIIVVPHMPRYGRWSIVRVTGPYNYSILQEHHDFGHILPVKVLTQTRSVNPYEEAVSAGLRQTMRNRLRLWNIDALGAEVESLLRAAETGMSDQTFDGHLPKLLNELEASAWSGFKRAYHGAEFEAPCILLLKALYGDDNVEHTGGRSERGADAICTYQDPLGIEHRLVVQIKMWEWDAGWTRPLRQIREAYDAYEGITAGVILSTSGNTTEEFERERAKLEKTLHIPVRVVLRAELMRLFLSRLPQMVVGSIVE